MSKRYKHFTLEERTSITALYQAGRSCWQIAAALDRAPSSISREIKRNVGYGANARYNPRYADDVAWSRRWRGARLERDDDLRNSVLERLTAGWSPEQIAGRLRLEGSTQQISHESIYRFIYAQIARTKDYSWRSFLLRAKSKRGWQYKLPNLIQNIKKRVSIHQRPACVQARKRLGHWEADLVHPQKSGSIHKNQVQPFSSQANVNPATPCSPNSMVNTPNPLPVSWYAGFNPCPKTEDDPLPRIMEPNFMPTPNSTISASRPIFAIHTSRDKKAPSKIPTDVSAAIYLAEQTQIASQIKICKISQTY